MTYLDSILENRHHFANKSAYCQSYDFSSSHLQMWELDHSAIELILWKCGAREDFWESLDSKEIKLVERKKINRKYSLEWVMLKLKLQSFGHLM